MRTQSNEMAGAKPQTGVALLAKRAIDVSVAAVALIASAPVMASAALLVKLTLGSPVLFVQPRPGRGGRVFRLYKLRTMSDEVARNGVPLSDEQRLSRVGRALRSLSIDELPQFLNVLKGDMSLVGPRPLLVEYLPRYTSEQRRRHEVLPGITGWAQVNGRNALTWDEKFRLDVWYVDHWSLLLDAKIMALTLGRVIKREGISHTGHATAPPFGGSEQGSAP